MDIPISLKNEGERVVGVGVYGDPMVRSSSEVTASNFVRTVIYCFPACFRGSVSSVAYVCALKNRSTLQISDFRYNTSIMSQYPARSSCLMSTELSLCVG